MGYIPSYGTPKQILLAPDTAFTQPATMTSSGIHDSNVDVIIKAGTPLGAATDFRLNASTTLQPASDGTIQAVALHDINMKNPVGAVVLRGVINIGVLDSDVQALYKPDVIAQLAKLNILVVNR